MSRPSRWPRRRRAALLVAALLVLGACSDDGGAAPAGEDDPTAAATGDRVAVSKAELGPFTEVDADDVAGPGTPLGGGLTVPEGALLQGAAFPDLVGGGFRALLLVTGDPVDVFDDLAGQASGLGMQGPPACLGAETQVGCMAHLIDGSDGESLTVTVTRKVDPLLGVVSGAGLLYRPPGSEDGASDDGGIPPTDPLPSVALPEPVPMPPDADIAAAVRAPGSPARRLELGSTLVGLPGPCACEGSGWSLVVRLDGVERDVLHGYARQFSDLGEPPDLEDGYRDDLTVLGVRIGQGAVTAEIRAALPDDGPAYAIISVRGA